MIVNKNKKDFEYLNDRGVKEIIHFTDIENLKSIATNGLLSRHLLDEQAIPYIFNDEHRYDGTSHINLSITNPNINMFYRFRANNPSRNYAVISLDISLIKELSPEDYYFTSTNAASNNAQKVSVEELFFGHRGNLPFNCPTDNQAEIIVKTAIHVKYINAIYVETMDDKEVVSKIFSTIDILCDPTKHRYRKGLVDKGTTEGLDGLFDCDQKILEVIDRIDKRKRDIEETTDNLVEPKVDIAEQFETEGIINQIYLNNWFATDKQFEQTQNLYIENKVTSYFDTYALPSRYFEDKKYDKSTSRKATYWQIQYKAVPFYEKERRTPNQLSAIAVLEKVINRGRMTRLSSSLENQIIELVDASDEYKTIRYAHQIQSTLVELVKVQKLKPGHKVGIENLDESIAKLVLDDLIELEHKIAEMYKVTPLFSDIEFSNSEADLIISNKHFGDQFVSIVLCTPLSKISRDFTRVQEIVDVKIDENILKYLLNYIFGFNEFRQNQIDGILRALNHQDSIVLLPTGSGKSVVYQLLSLITPGISFVVDPIVSLAYDQVDNLYRKGIDRVTELVADTEDKKQVETDMSRGQYFMNFVAPERFQNQTFRNMIEYYARTNIISVIAIDEAHCVSEWGHDFRTSYLSLAQTCRTICTTVDGTPPPLLALTGTASASVLRDMQRDLNILEEEAIIQPESFDRKEIDFRVVNCNATTKEKTLQNIIVNDIPSYFGKSFNDFYQTNGDDTNCGLVFCAIAGENRWRNGNYHPFGTRNIQNLLNTWLPEKRCGIYNGQVQSDVKKINARQFKNNELVALSATKSYGMGIDKPNIRWAVHYGISSSIESYYQEAGRCARDGKKAVSWIILSNDYPDDNLRLLDSTKTSVNKLQVENDRIKGSRPWEGDDVSRIVYFHTNSFSGVEKELDLTKFVLNYLLNNKYEIPFVIENKNELEKTIYRLILIGFVSDYTVNYQRNTIDVKVRSFSPELIETYYREYISGYQEDEGYLKTQIELLKRETTGFEKSPENYLLAAVKTLLNEFTYKIVEEGRRIAMRNMLVYTTEASKIENPQKSGEYLRKKILDYLSTSEKIRIQDLISKATNIKFLDEFFNKITSKRLANKVITQISRLLEAYPEHFGLYYIMLKAQVKYDTYEAAIKSMNYALHYGVQSYGMEKETLYKKVVSLICNKETSESEWNSILQIVKNELGEKYIQKLLEEFDNDSMKNVYLINSLRRLSNLTIKEM